MTLDLHTLAVGVVAFAVGWVLSQLGDGRLRRDRRIAAAYLEGYEKGQEAATSFFAAGGRGAVKLGPVAVAWYRGDNLTCIKCQAGPYVNAGQMPECPSCGLKTLMRGSSDGRG